MLGRVTQPECCCCRACCQRCGMLRCRAAQTACGHQHQRYQASVLSQGRCVMRTTGNGRVMRRGMRGAECRRVHAQRLACTTGAARAPWPPVTAPPLTRSPREGAKLQLPGLPAYANRVTRTRKHQQHACMCVVREACISSHDSWGVGISSDLLLTPRCSRRTVYRSMQSELRNRFREGEGEGCKCWPAHQLRHCNSSTHGHHNPPLPPCHLILPIH